MSGSGMIAGACALRVTPEFAAEAERDAAIDHVRKKIAFLQKRGGEGTEQVIRVLDELANDFDQALHVPEGGA